MSSEEISDVTRRLWQREGRLAKGLAGVAGNGRRQGDRTEHRAVVDDVHRPLWRARGGGRPHRDRDLDRLIQRAGVDRHGRRRVSLGAWHLRHRHHRARRDRAGGMNTRQNHAALKVFQGEGIGRRKALASFLHGFVPRKSLGKSSMTRETRSTAPGRNAPCMSIRDLMSPIRFPRCRRSSTTRQYSNRPQIENASFGNS